MGLASDIHRPVLIDEALKLLIVDVDGNYVDCTFGRGGYSAQILQQLSQRGFLVAIDRDPDAIAYGLKKFADERRLQLIHSDFAQVGSIVTELKIDNKISGVVADLGLSSPQLDNADRGFSFMRLAPLDMRMNPTEGMTAAQWLRRASVAEIADILWKYGEERHSRRIAKAIKASYPHHPIDTTSQLAELVTTIVPFKASSKKHPATCTFQAIRIFINGELKQLEVLLASLNKLVKVGGRIVIVSFHSLEDRMVKRFFRSLCAPARLPKEIPVRDSVAQPNWKLCGKPIYANKCEIDANPRARSAVLRCIERVG